VVGGVQTQGREVWGIGGGAGFGAKVGHGRNVLISKKKEN
jgi:hypothetical protein